MKKIVVFMITALMLTQTAAAEEPELDMEMEPEEDVDAAVFEEGAVPVDADALEIAAPSAILIEKETGTVIYEKNADERLEPASVTKVMTILLIVEAVESGELSLDEVITVSARASSMGGSQVYLREGEQMALSEMLKCIVVSSANDAAVAVAEHMSGTEQNFALRMNNRAAELGMTNSHFTNCTGLLDDSEHLTTARDISIMSRELIKHDWIKEYTTIWTDTIRDGSFGLSSTNKLIRFYNGATGLKTGYTSRAGHCLSATAERDGVEYIAVVMHCGSSTERFESAKALLSYAFSTYTLVAGGPGEVLPPIPVTLGKSDYIQPVCVDTSPVLVKKMDADSVTRAVTLADELAAPIAAGQKVGTLTIALNGETLSETDIISPDAVEKLSFWDVCRDMLRLLFFGG